METIFARVKGAIGPQADEILRDYGIKHHRGSVRLSGEWTTGFLCPFCGDQSGSASFTIELYLKCHQCSFKGDMFDWLSKHLGKRPLEVCKELADRLKVDVGPKAKRPGGRSMPGKMTEDVLEHALRDLWEHPDAQPARDLLAERGLDDQRTLLGLEIGWIKGWIVFTRRDDSGRLEDRYRGWAPKDPKIKWRWFGAGSGGPGIWPNNPAPDGAKVLLCEGESDALTAMVKVGMHRQGWHVATWTAGATSSPKASAIPKSWHGKEVHVAYDNDVFQGPDYPNYIVIAKPGKDANHARQAAEQRLKNLLQNLCPMFQQLNCTVVVRQCPVDPTVNYGGDLRDWASSGGRDFDADWKSFPFEDLPALGAVVLELRFDEVFNTLNRQLKTRTQVDMIGADDLVIPVTMKMECSLGSHQACAQCQGLRLFPDGVINLEEHQRERAVGIESGTPNEYLARHVVQRPKACPSLELVTIESKIGSEWRGIRPGSSDETTLRNLKVISEEPPSLSGEVDIVGEGYSDARGKGVIFYAHRVTSLDRSDVNLSPLATDFLMTMPWATNDAAEIDSYLDRRWRDLACHVTKIHGRRDIQIATDLLAHSVLHFVAGGAKQRGWLDIAIFGETRSGKSVTARRMLEHHGLGVIHTAVSNISRAGLVMGAAKDNLLKPGLFPKQNGKMLYLDEWHFICQHSRGFEHPMTWLQAPRDNGVTSGVKIYGSRDLKAMVRFCVIANWIQNQRRTYEFGCEHLAELYGAPETIARLDFGLPVGPEPTQLALDEVEQFWTSERTRALILRAWGQESSQVHIEPEAETYAHQKALDWKDLYDSERIPLFTPEEKWISLLRVATAIANLTFSKLPQGDLYSVHVRPVHVEWAASWLEYCWREAGYDTYSQARLASSVVEKKFEAEKQFTVNLNLADADSAEAVLSQLLRPFGANELGSIIGKDPLDTTKWIARMQALRVFERLKSSGQHVQFGSTRGGNRLIRNLLTYARNDPIQWTERYKQISMWLGPADPEGLTPMTVENWELLGDDPHRQTLPF